MAREDDIAYRPSSFYGAAKSCGELLMRSYAPVLSTTVLRLYHPYGPGGDRFLINRLSRRVVEGQPVHIEGREGILINPVWIEDLAIGIRQAVESDASGVFHLAGPRSLYLRELLEITGSVVGRDPVIFSEEREPARKHAGAFDAASLAFGYDPKVTVREGLQRLCSGYWRQLGGGERGVTYA